MEASPPPGTQRAPFHPPPGAFSAAGAFHPDQRPERPFPEEDPGSDGDGFLKPGPQPPSQLDGLKHFLQQVSEGAPALPPSFPTSSSSFPSGVQARWLLSQSVCFPSPKFRKAAVRAPSSPAPASLSPGLACPPSCWRPYRRTRPLLLICCPRRQVSGEGGGAEGTQAAGGAPSASRRPPPAVLHLLPSARRLGGGPAGATPPAPCSQDEGAPGRGVQSLPGSRAAPEPRTEQRPPRRLPRER